MSELSKEAWETANGILHKVGWNEPQSLANAIAAALQEQMDRAEHWLNVNKTLLEQVAALNDTRATAYGAGRAEVEEACQNLLEVERGSTKRAEQKVAALTAERDAARRACTLLMERGSGEGTEQQQAAWDEACRIGDAALADRRSGAGGNR